MNVFISAKLNNIKASFGEDKARIKNAVKDSVVRSRDYVLSLQRARKVASVEESAYQHHDTVYPWLNAIFTKLTSDPRSGYRPTYTWGLLHSANLARSLGIKRISAIELGVAGGNGLISLEKIAQVAEEIFGIGIDVYGFDTGAGLPKPEDYRDLPNLYKESAFAMDIEKLEDRLKKAQLVLGLVCDTVESFIHSIDVHKIL